MWRFMYRMNMKIFPIFFIDFAAVFNKEWESKSLWYKHWSFKWISSYGRRFHFKSTGELRWMSALNTKLFSAPCTQSIKQNTFFCIWLFLWNMLWKFYSENDDELKVQLTENNSMINFFSFNLRHIQWSMRFKFKANSSQ